MTQIDEIVDGIYRISTFAPETGLTFTGDALGYYTQALREQEFAYRGMLLGRALGV